MSFAYTEGGLGGLNETQLTGDQRAILVMTDTTADTDEDAEFVSDITTLDEYDGSGYARVALTTEAWASDPANDRWEFTADAIVFAALGVGTRQAAGLIIYWHVTDDDDSQPEFYYNGTGFPFDGNGEDVTFTPNTELVHVRNAD